MLMDASCPRCQEEEEEAETEETRAHRLGRPRPAPSPAAACATAAAHGPHGGPATRCLHYAQGLWPLPSTAQHIGQWPVEGSLCALLRSTPAIPWPHGRGSQNVLCRQQQMKWMMRAALLAVLAGGHTGPHPPDLDRKSVV